MEDYILGTKLILIVIAAILRIDGIILIYTKRKRIWTLPPLILNMIAPIICIVAVSYVTSKGWKGIGKKNTVAHDTLVYLFVLLFSQISAGLNLVFIVALMGLPVPDGRGIGPAADPSSFMPHYLLFIIVFMTANILCLLRIIAPQIRIIDLFKGKDVPKFSMISLVILGPFLILTWALGFLLGEAGLDTSTNPIMSPSDLPGFIALFIGIVVLAPFIEELFFRGYLFRFFEDRLGGITAIYLTASIFALAHFDLIILLPLFFMGAIMGWVRLKTGSLWPSLVLHSANNLFALIFITLS